MTLYINGVSISTLAQLDVDNLRLDGNVLSSTSGAVTVTPLAGQNLNVSLSGAGDFAVNTNQWYVDTSTGFNGMGTPSPLAKLEINNADQARLLINENTGTDGDTAELLFQTSNGSTLLAKGGIIFEKTGSNSIGNLYLVNRTTADATVASISDAKLTILNSGNVGIGISIGLDGKTHIDQSSTTAAIPVLTLDQADVDEDFFKFIGTSDTNVDRALVDAADFTTPGSIVGWLKINIQDDQATNPIADGDYYLPFYSAPSA